MANDDKDKNDSASDDKTKRDSLKSLIKEVFNEVILEERESGRTDKGKESAEKQSRSSVFDVFGL